GVSPLRGRFFAPDEQREGGTPAVVSSYGFWRRTLGGAPLDGGLTLEFDRKVFTVVGVAPPELDDPAGTDVWLPAELFGRNPHRTAHNWRVLARLAPSVTLEQATTEAG